METQSSKSRSLKQRVRAVRRLCWTGGGFAVGCCLTLTLVRTECPSHTDMVQASPREIAVDISAKLADALEQLRVTRLRVRMLESELSASKADVTLCSSELGDLKANASRCWSQLGYGLLESKQKKYQEIGRAHV
eukprot:TRINITY_DN57651_c0_g1_i1.p1 TRINITY_DN57651_c0_g1~~TRINITY_DN57651_c0_g1_i1.p1  ORF type:complete len:135 (-),score=24.43 TRINITY_DN57651_c0_g1_i1:16-420(-)